MRIVHKIHTDKVFATRCLLTYKDKFTGTGSDEAVTCKACLRRLALDQRIEDMAINATQGQFDC